jgi:hypothetical protein
MKVRNLSFVMTIMVLFIRPCVAGNGSGGGGFTITCRNTRGQIETTELLDLYEARTVYHHALIASSGEREQDYLAALKNTFTLQGFPNAYIEGIAKEMFRSFFDIVRFTNPGEKLLKMNDLGETPPLPNGCRYEQVAAFGGGETPSWPNLKWGIIDSEIWNALGSQSQAALVFHELDSAGFRFLAEKTSQNARIEVGLSFSKGILPVGADLPLENQYCETLDSDTNTFEPDSVSTFYAFPSQNLRPARALAFQFSTLMGRPLFTRTTALFPDLPRLILEKSSTGIPMVSDSNANYTRVTNLLGDQTPGWQLELQYVYQKPAQLTLIVKGQHTASAFITCLN